ncbi:hypothetical protein CDAR_17781 [Caerostris darwini]|uniref:Uncharacterized protein n=1 Tax=Caerostris darwini TaxID=1538125 RepID=A0AAV4MBI0_9ARAC|nr:hypothetical protein CDAR_17781 [Caerostris darwini]
MLGSSSSRSRCGTPGLSRESRRDSQDGPSRSELGLIELRGDYKETNVCKTPGKLGLIELRGDYKETNVCETPGKLGLREPRGIIKKLMFVKHLER